MPDHAAASRAIALSVLAMPEVTQARAVACYVGGAGEVATDVLIDGLLEAGIAVGVPVTGDDGWMMMAAIDSRDELVPGLWGIAVPASVRPMKGAIDVSICPGLLFTRDGRRLGRGGGHYDRFLAAHPATLAIGLCFTAQLVDDLPTEPHDRAMHVVVTEAGVHRTARG